MLKGTFIAVKAYIKKEKKSEISILTIHLHELEKEQTKPTASKRRKIVKKKKKTTAEIK